MSDPTKDYRESIARAAAEGVCRNLTAAGIKGAVPPLVFGHIYLALMDANVQPPGEASIPPPASGEQRQFPILHGELPLIPWEVIGPHAAQAERNHGQSLERLAQRGGLSTCEAVAVIEDRPWRRMVGDESLHRLRELCKRPAPPAVASSGEGRTPPPVLQELAAAVGGTIDEVGALPDGSGFATMSYPLPADHWSLADGFDEPPAAWRMGTGPKRSELAEIIRAAGRYAYRAATMNGKEPDLDPDALLQNLVVGFLGYWTHDGHSHIDEPTMPVPSAPEPRREPSASVLTDLECPQPAPAAVQNPPPDRSPEV